MSWTAPSVLFPASVFQEPRMPCDPKHRTSEIPGISIGEMKQLLAEVEEIVRDGMPETTPLYRCPRIGCPSVGALCLYYFFMLNYPGGTKKNE